MSIPKAILIGSVLIALVLFITTPRYIITGQGGVYIKMEQVTGVTEVCMLKDKRPDEGFVLVCNTP